MRSTKATLSLLILSVALATPASAQSYFANPLTGQNLNVGSAPNPTPADRVEFAQVPPPVEPAPPPSAPYSPPPVVQPPAPPPLAQAAPPPPPVRMFVVFFDFDKYDLTEEAQDIVRQAVDEARRQPVRVMITGHTDTVGSRAYNQRLSERRAESVKTAMVRAGIDADDISTVGRNFSDPLVPTGPGIREPQNRRAVIDLGGAIS
jgi:outer membrane protein OmpA-like peptidoglycan-associated protein